MSLYQAIVCLILTKTILASNVTILTTKNFNQLVNNDSIWVVQFYSSKTKSNHNLAKEFSQGADILKGVVRFGAVDIENNIELTKNFTINVKYLPTIKLFGLSNDGAPKEYKGPKIARDLVESVMKNLLEKIKKQFGNELPENSIVELTDKNFDEVVTKSKEPWMVLFYAPWCVHCKELKPIWSLVASSLQKKIKCASIDATTNKLKAKEYKITAYPTIKLFPFANKSPKYVYDYTQDRSVDNIVDWALEKLPAPKLVQITHAGVFQKHCLDQKLCVITVFPSILDCKNSCRRNYLSILQRLTDKFKKSDWEWVWTEASAQQSLEDTLHIKGFGYPTLVALNPVKMKYSVFKGAFTKSKIEEFLKGLAKATAVRVEDEDIGKNIVTVAAWDEGDLVKDEL